MIRVAINGFGRIGRTSARVIFDKFSQEIELVAINDLTDNKTLAHLLKFDTQYREFNHRVESDEQFLFVDGKKILSLSEKDPLNLPWAENKIDVVLECTGRFTEKETASAHLKSGAKAVVISAPSKDAPTVVLGVNHQIEDGQEAIISNASCTTNCITPVIKVLHERFGVAKAMMTTIHSYTADQNLQDGPHKDLRRARAAAENIVPTSTGAAKATFNVIPDMKGLFDGLALRVPTPVVSLSDFTLLLKTKTTLEEINRVLIEASESPTLKGILAVTDEELVSSDFIGNPASSIVDLKLTQVVDGDLVKVVAWYDNEYGYSNRLIELALQVVKN